MNTAFAMAMSMSMDINMDTDTGMDSDMHNDMDTGSCSRSKRLSDINLIFKTLTLINFAVAYTIAVSELISDRL
jgi:hypothetical protein